MMKQILIILVAITYATARPGSRIHGGQNAGSGQFPFMVSMNNGFSQSCDGAIIAPNWILTAAQCVYFGHLDSAFVYVGSNVNFVDGTSYKMAQTIFHENFDSWTYENDIGLIRIDGEFEYSDTVQPIEIGDPPSDNSTCTLVGFGTVEGGLFPEVLQYIDLPTIADWEVCRSLGGASGEEYYLGQEQVCTVGSGGQGICAGDQGGPLVCDGKLVGINSFNIDWGCGGRLPQMHIRAAYYRDWIQEHIQG